MIKINLVPLKEKKKQQEYIFVLLGAVITIFLASGMFWIYIQKIQAKRDLNVQIKRVEDESKGYQDRIAEITAFQDTETRLDAANKNINDIQLVQKKVVFVLDQLANNLPDGVWITSITQGAKKDADSFVVDGCAFTLDGVKEYFDGLVKTQGLSKDATLEIKSIVGANLQVLGNSTVGKNRQIIQFEITTKAVDAAS
jgi:type IV pilus assembly protein PilN